MLQPVEALLFDLGRVIIDIDTARAHRRWSQLTGLSVETLQQRYASNVAGSELFHRHERGEISDAEFAAALGGLLGTELTEAHFIDGWNSIFVGEMPGIRAVLASVRVPIYGFSNTNAAHQTYWSVRFADLLAPFRKIYVSNEIGARKPDVSAFQAVAADMGFARDRIAFFDDLQENVDGAHASGLQAFRVTSAQETARVIEGLRFA